MVMAVPVIADKEAAFRKICPPPSNMLPVSKNGYFLVIT
jgi:hypothetical protein